MFGAIARFEDASADDFKSTYALISGGEPCDRTARRVSAEIQRPLYEGYGLTETSPVVCLNVPQSNRAGSVGKAIPNVTMKIADEDGKTCRAASPGRSGSKARWS